MSQKDVINRIKEVAASALPDDASLLLYGSRARGEARPDSDWDLLILLNKDKIEQADHDNVAYHFTYLGWELNEMIVPILYTKRDWERQSFLPFHKNVEQDKIVLK